MTVEALLTHMPFADWTLNTALYSLLVLVIGSILLRMLRKTSAPLLSGVCLALMLVLLTLPFVSLMNLWESRPLLNPGLISLKGPDQSLINKGPLGTNPGTEDVPVDTYQDIKKSGAAQHARLRSSVLLYAVAVINGLGLVWLVGFIILFGRLALGMLRIHFFKCSLINCQIPDWPHTSASLQKAFPRARLPLICMSPLVQSPITCGLLKPVVILPAALCSRFNPKDIQNILLHEMSHIRHKDLALGLLQRTMTTFYWWNPLAHHLNRVLSESREEIGDNHAIRASSPLEFARCLASLAEQIRETQKKLSCLALATSKPLLEQRIRRILNGERGLETRLKKPVAIALLCSVLLFLAGILRFPWALAARQVNQVVASLSELKNPTSITVDGGQVFITEEKSVSIYALEDFRLIRRFGKLGEGPGEFRLRPCLTAYPDHLLIGNFGKLSLFTRNGDFLREAEIPFRYFYMYYPMLPVGKNHVGFNLKKDEQGTFIHVGTIYDSELQPIKEFYRGGPPKLLPPPKPDTAKALEKVDYEVISDCMDVAVWKDKIYVGDTRKGFSIEIFDEDGNLLSTINTDYERIEIPQSLKDSFMKNIRGAENSEDLLRRFNFKFRKYFPAFFSFTVRDGKMYFSTYAQKNGKFELVEMDLEGKVLKRSFVFPLHPLRRISQELFSFKNEYDIHDGKLYYLERNPLGQGFLLHQLILD